jgi:hypothetical protein
MLPSWEAIQSEDLLYRKHLVGKYMGDMYGAATSSGYGFSLLHDF